MWTPALGRKPLHHLPKMEGDTTRGNEIMSYKKIIFCGAEKIINKIVISSYYDSDPNLIYKSIIKQKDVYELLSVLKDINHDPDIDIKQDPNDNISMYSIFERQDDEYSISVGVIKYNYSFELNEFKITTFWENSNIESSLITFSYKNFEDLRRQLDSLIAEIEKVI